MASEKKNANVFAGVALISGACLQCMPVTANLFICLLAGSEVIVTTDIRRKSLVRMPSIVIARGVHSKTNSKYVDDS